MRRRLYFLLPDVESSKRTADDLLLARVEDRHMRFLAKRGTPLSGLHEAGFLQKSDAVHGAQLGLVLGGVIGFAIGVYIYLTPPQGVPLELRPEFLAHFGTFQFFDQPQGTAAEQRRDSDSMLNWTERIIRMRKEVPEIGWGDFEILKTGDPAVLAIRYDWRNNSVLFMHNFAEDPREVEFLSGLKGEAGEGLVGQERALDGPRHSRQLAPVGAELECHDDPGHNAEPESHTEDLQPELEHLAIGWTPGR